MDQLWTQNIVVSRYMNQQDAPISLAIINLLALTDKMKVDETKKSPLPNPLHQNSKP